MAKAAGDPAIDLRWRGIRLGKRPKIAPELRRFQRKAEPENRPSHSAAVQAAAPKRGLSQTAGWQRRIRPREAFMLTQRALKRLTAMLCGVMALLAISGPAAAEKRVALVIGNSAYQHTAVLKNPSNDATDIAGKLRALGFEVIDGTDLSKADMESRIRAFADKLQGSDVGLFFYAGHGLAADGRNFLAPVDAKLQSETDLDFEAVDLSLVLKQMERNSRVSLVFLDACRDNPLALNLAATSRSLQVSRGLARVDRAVGMMIAFSTQPGNVALDGEGRNSPFTDALLHHIDAEGASINDMMIEVRNDVLKATDGKQVPWENSSLTGQFFFKPAAPPTIADKSAE